jgi:hypothetical protein
LRLTFLLAALVIAAITSVPADSRAELPINVPS